MSSLNLGGVVGGLLAALLMGVSALPGSAHAQRFSPARTLTTTAVGFQAPQVGTWEGDVHVVWVDGAAEGTEVRYQRSMDGGLSFQPVHSLSAPSAVPSANVRGVKVLANGLRRRGTTSMCCGTARAVRRHRASISGGAPTEAAPSSPSNSSRGWERALGTTR